MVQRLSKCRLVAGLPSTRCVADWNPGRKYSGGGTTIL